MDTNIQNILRSEGIYAKGFGIIPKKVMTDPDLTADAKAIYAYFCSYAGAGETAFPSRDRILLDLNISPNCYYRHLKSLTQTGLILVAQENLGGKGRGFQRNIYTLVNLPEKYKDDNIALPSDAAISSTGLKIFGYGTISKSVMTNPAISAKAKALYAYLCAFTGGGVSAFPRRNDTCHFLKMSKDTYTKYLAELSTAGLITVRQRRISGKLSVCDYFINEFLNTAGPEEGDNTTPCPKIEYTQNEPCPKIEYTQPDGFNVSPCPKNGCPQKPCPQNEDAIINNINNNSIKNKQHDHLQAPKSFIDLLSDDDWDVIEQKFDLEALDAVLDQINDSFEGREEALKDIKHPLNYFKTVAKSLGY